MNELDEPTISIAVPLFNEALGIEVFHNQLLNELSKIEKYQFEIIYCDDGSTDNTTEIIKKLELKKYNIKLIQFSRNFGKEIALTACINEARGNAVITLDGDGQHPQHLIADFINSWEKGAKVVIGVRKNNMSEGISKKLGSWIFYKSINNLTGQKLVVGSTDFRLIDRSVQKEFIKLTEPNRITRALIDWLGFKRHYIYFDAVERIHGSPGYSTKKLIKLAVDSFVSISPRPLYLFGYLGVGISFISFITGLIVIIEQLILGDPLNWSFTGTAMLGILIIFLVGIVLMSQGILSVYTSMLNIQSKQRPLYIIDYDESIGLKVE